MVVVEHKAEEAVRDNNTSFGIFDEDLVKGRVVADEIGGCPLGRITRGGWNDPDDVGATPGVIGDGEACRFLRR